MERMRERKYGKNKKDERESIVRMREIGYRVNSKNER